MNKKLKQFSTICIDEMVKVKLLNRFDTKYWIPTEELNNILSEISEKYYVLEINGSRIQQYETAYFDTKNNTFYNMHHNGKAGRIKIRKRSYVNSNIAFLEIKIKNNKGKTSKSRMPINHLEIAFTRDEKKFIRKYAACKTSELELKTINTFQRITLVSKKFDERCTIDVDLAFSNGKEIMQMSELAIIELKQGERNMKSELSMALKKNHIYKRGFSKYCLARALIETSIKKNLFKARLLKLEKDYLKVPDLDVRSHEIQIQKNTKFNYHGKYIQQYPAFYNFPN